MSGVRGDARKRAQESQPAPEVGLTEAERETSRRWLYMHNGAQGPNPITEGAGGLGGLWSLVARIKADAARQALLDAANETRRMPADPEKAAQWLRDRAARLNDGSGA